MQMPSLECWCYRSCPKVAVDVTSVVYMHTVPGSVALCSLPGTGKTRRPCRGTWQAESVRAIRLQISSKVYQLVFCWCELGPVLHCPSFGHYCNGRLMRVWHLRCAVGLNGNNRSMIWAENLTLAKSTRRQPLCSCQE